MLLYFLLELTAFHLVILRFSRRACDILFSLHYGLSASPLLSVFDSLRAYSEPPASVSLFVLAVPRFPLMFLLFHLGATFP